MTDFVNRGSIREEKTSKRGTTIHLHFKMIIWKAGILKRDTYLKITVDFRFGNICKGFLSTEHIQE